MIKCVMSTCIFIFVLIWTITITNSQIEKQVPSQNSTIIALKFTGMSIYPLNNDICIYKKVDKITINVGLAFSIFITDHFIRTFHDDTYDNVVVVSRSSLNNSDTSLDQFTTLMVSAQKSLIKFTTIYFR